MTDLTAQQEFFGTDYHQKVLELLKKLRPIDDTLMRELFRDSPELTGFVLGIITSIPDLKVESQETQFDMERLAGARSLRMDVLASDSLGRKYNIEVQRSDRGAVPKRARYHSSALDIEFLKAGQDFSELPITYVIFITENDVIGGGLPVYHIDRTISETGGAFDDGEHIIFVNGAYDNSDDSSELAKLIHDFKCSSADDMYLDPLSERVRCFKEKEKGVSNMCRAEEELMEEVKEHAGRIRAFEFAAKLIQRGKDTPREISDLTGLSLEELEALAEKVKLDKEQQST